MNLSHRQEKIQAKRKQTPWRDFVRDISSRYQVTLYKNKGLVSRYPDTPRVNKLLSALDFFQSMESQTACIEDPTASVFDNFGQLMQNTALPALWHWGICENSNYADTCYQAKNAYLSTIACFSVENVLYSSHVAGNCTNVINSVFVATNCDNIYDCSNIVSSFNIFFSKSVEGSSNIWYSSNLIACQECISCHDLENKSYCIDNIQYAKEEYMKLKQSAVQQYLAGIKQRPSGEQDFSQFRCEGVSQARFCADVSSGRNIVLASRDESGTKSNLYDVMSTGGAIDHAYGCMGVSPGDHFYCCVNCATCSHVYYSMFLGECSYCFGCIGLRNKKYCIYNVQYTKEERMQKVDEIFAQMENTPANPLTPLTGGSQLGEFFPGSLCPFYFNDTAAMMLDTGFTKKEVTDLGYLRRDEEIKTDIPDWMETVKVEDLSQYESRKDAVWTIDPDILKKVIVDEQGNSYRVIKMEYDFLVKYALLLPRKHWLYRIQQNFLLL